MSKIVITYDYEPNMPSYPDYVDTKADAMRFDVEQINNGVFSVLEFLDDDQADLTIEVVE